ncbi:MAG: hypothetical protein ACREL4_01065 [Gemmatimonadales bacterium]
MRNGRMVGTALVIALVGFGSPLAAQRSCSGPNGCSMSMSVGATVVGTHVASGARMAVRPNPASAKLEVVTAANTGWVLSIGGVGGTNDHPVDQSGRGGSAVAPVPQDGPTVVVATLAAS